MEKAARIWERDAAYENAYIRSSRLNLLFLVAVVIMGLVIWKQSGKKMLVVGLNELGVPYHLQKTEKSLPGPEQAELFIREFISLVDSYDSDSWRKNLELATQMMTSNFASVYEDEIERSGYEKYVKRNNVTQTAVVKDLHFVGQKTVKGNTYYRVQALVERTRIADNVPSTELMEFIIDLQRVPITTTRYGLYGLKVSGMQKKPANS